MLRDVLIQKGLSNREAEVAELVSKGLSNKEVARYYDLSEVHYRLFWNLQESKSLHYGYWDSSTKNFHQALLNI
ncbi:MAG: LuxR C-terminal-related transcriptional regulator, partial [Bdellovibrionota bacterium]